MIGQYNSASIIITVNIGRKINEKLGEKKNKRDKN